MHREMGKPLAEALGEVDFSAAIYGFYAENAERFLADESIDLLAGEGSAVIQRRPVGVILGIMPWNFPAYQVARFAGPNLTLGNTIVLKHAPQCPESAEALQKIFDDAGYPAGAYVNVYATNEQIAAAIADPRVQGVSLTGSERAGAAVAEIAGRNLKKVVLELGGSDPFILLSTDDLDATVDAAVAARMGNTGQACNAAKRIIVAENLYDDFVDRFTAKILAAADDLSPLSSEAAAQNLARQVDAAVVAFDTLKQALDTVDVADAGVVPDLTRFALSVDQSTKRATWPARSAGLALNASKVSTSAASRSPVVWKNLLCVVRFLVSFHAPSVGL
jgi:succinate-semialdehyde dehydrogenase/glutarate-semialdehyde dehydrogenase